VADEEPAAPQVGGIKKKTLITIAVVTLAVWAFAVQTGSTILMIVVGVLTALLLGVVGWALLQLRKQRGLIGLLRGAADSPEARRDALAKLDGQKDAGEPVNVFARAQLLAADDPKAALKLLETVPMSKFHAAMQDDVALLLAQLYLGVGRTQDARKAADTINVDNPERKEVRAMAAAIISEAWARTGKPKEALALLDTIELPKKDAAQLATQIRVVRVFAKFAANQRGPARTELQQLADEDVNNLGRFLMPQFRVHPELQKLARAVLEQHPQARAMSKQQARGQKQR
jgi:tetratricopeptide (TPR) repeat protein